MPLVILPREGSHVGSIDLSGLTPDRLAGLSATAIERMPIGIDGRLQPLASVFAISGSLDDDQGIECRGDFSRVHGLGAGMRCGRIDVRGPVGHRAGARMEGGEMVVSGSAGNYLAAGMRGGTIRITGDAGDDAAAAFPGDAHGVTGGLILIEGSVGRLAAARMRRGIVAIGGDCGPGAGFELRAGTVVVAGSLGPHAGLGMRRGSIVAAGRPAIPGPTFLAGATWSPPFLTLLERRLLAAGFRPRTLHPAPGKALSWGWSSATWTQWHGETITGGKGEFWVRAA